MSNSYKPPSMGCRDICISKMAQLVRPANYSVDDGTVPAYTGFMPDQPSTAVCFTDTGGLASDPKWLLDFPTVSVLVRDANYEEGWDYMFMIRESLLGLPAGYMNQGDTFQGITAIGNMAFIGVDAKERSMFSANFRIYLLPDSSDQTNRQPL